MKATTAASFIFLTAAVCYGQASKSALRQVPSPTAYRVMKEEANSQVWQRETYQLSPEGNIVTNIDKYTELATGMNYKDAGGQWQKSQELIESYPGGAIARHGQYQVIFANNLNSYGAIDMQTPDGKRLQSNILGLMYHDTASGDAVLIAQITNSTGELISANKVLYPNAFAGVKADVRYTYKRGSFEQDVILREQLPPAESYGMNPDTTEVEVMTEFHNPPPEIVTQVGVQANGENDETVSWGRTRLCRGRAFSLGQGSNSSAQISVTRQYRTVDGRKVLLEKVPVESIQAALARLPQHASIKIKQPVMAFNQLNLPKPPTEQHDQKPIKMAMSTPSGTGYVLDYVTVNSDSGYLFQGDTTYYISGDCNFSGYSYTGGLTQVIFEGGTVIKYATNAGLSVYQGLIFKTAPYRPAVLTAKDDNSVGETISGSTGTPVGYYASEAIADEYDSIAFHDLRFKYCLTGLADNSSEISVYDCQFVNTGTAIMNGAWATLNVYNVLLSDLLTGFSANGAINVANMTAHHVGHIIDMHGGTFNVTNSLFICVTNMTISGGSFNCGNDVTNSSDVGVFQTVGAGGHYLAANSPYRNAGTTNIDLTLLADLADKTTYPPIVYSNTTISVATTLSPQAQRDSDTPDLGYHYAPLDYLVDYYQITNAVLTVCNGTAIGGYLDNPDIWLQQGSSIVAIGTPTQPIQFTFYNTVQEQPAFLSSIAQTNFSYACLINPYHAGDTLTTAATGVFKFAKFTGLARSGVPFYHAKSNWDFRSLLVENCEICTMYGYNIFSVDTNTTTLFFNNLFQRISMSAQGNTGAMLAFSNNLFWACPNVSLLPLYGTIVADNNSFDSSHLTGRQLLGGIIYNDYNAYMNCTGSVPFTNSGPHNVIDTNSLAYENGPLGEFYQPSSSPLINVGSTTADLVGLYHFTTQTNQVKETNSVVDIGYHYVAVDTNDVPFDANGNGIPDYLDDANGNGMVDSGEIGWNITGDLGLKVIITRPRNGASLP